MKLEVGTVCISTARRYHDGTPIPERCVIVEVFDGYYGVEYGIDSVHGRRGYAKPEQLTPVTTEQ